MKRLKFLVAVVSLLALFAPAVAQTPPPASFVTVATIKVRPAAVADFEDYLKRVQAAGLKIGLKARADTYQVVQGGSPFQYDVVQGFQTLDDVGAVPAVPAQLSKAYGDTESARLMRVGRAAIETVEFTTMQYRADLSTKPALPIAAPFFQIVRQEIDPQLVPEYTAYLRRVKEAGDKFAAAPTSLRHTNLFGPAFIYLTAQPFSTWAERAKWANPADPLVAAFGDAEAAKLADINRRAVRARSIWIVQHRADLSRIPGTS
jgi:hypothetical protein